MKINPPKINIDSYFDYAASTPLDKQVLKSMLPYFGEHFGNSSSIHTPGQIAQNAIDLSRQKISLFLGCNLDEIIFTSGATESNNLALHGVIEANQSKNYIKHPNIITTTLEHASVLQPLSCYAKQGIKIYYIKPNQDGTVDVNKIIKTINKNTLLISVIYVNNIIGTIQPVAEIGRAIKSIQKQNHSQFPVFHTDATQAINYLNCKVEYLKSDLLTFSGHKIYGPKGIGILYKRQGVNLSSIFQGGGHENNLRSGTLNTPGIVGVGKAIELIEPNQNIKIAKLRDLLITEILKIGNSHVYGTPNNKTPNMACFYFNDISAQDLVIALDLENIYVSAGPACASKSLMSNTESYSFSNGVRFSLGKFTTEKSIRSVVKKLALIINRFRKL